MKRILATWFKFFYPYSLIKKMINFVMPCRRIIVIAIQFILFALANYFSFYTRFEGNMGSYYFNFFLTHLPVILFVRGTFLYVFGLDKGLWRYAGGKDLMDIAFATTMGTATIVIIQNLLGNVYYPRSIYIIDWFLNVFLLGGIRLFRGFHEFDEIEISTRKRVILIGAGSAAELLLRDIGQSAYYPYQVIGFIDDDPRKRGLAIRGIPVLGMRQDLKEIVEREKPDEFIITIPSSTKEEFGVIIKDLRQYAIPIKAIPSFWNILTGTASIHSIKTVNPEDVLFRAPTSSVDEKTYHFFNGKRILITGAGGSIGSELSRQINQCGPSALMLFERHEENLYKIDMELKTKRGVSSETSVSHIYSIIGDILDEKRLDEVMEKYKPEIIIHAAAYKHVPLMEDNPSEAFKTNVQGTKMLAQKARQYNVKRFILISTDKAVNPVNVMGKTKKAAEEIVRYNSQNGKANNGSSTTKYMAVRFGNVLDSSGSVVPLFRHQIENGGPVTVTHPDMVRYFMTIPEAVHLVLEATVLGEGGEIFVLDMGKPIKILDLAKRMISLYGYTVGKDIHIVFPGLRPGEKLYENLFNDDEIVEKTSHPKINKAISKKSVDLQLLEKMDVG